MADRHSTGTTPCPPCPDCVLSASPLSSTDALADALAGLAWFNGLTRAERALWLDRAWKRASPPGEYSLDSMPSAADAWAAFKGTQYCPDCSGLGRAGGEACGFCGAPEPRP